MTEPTTKRILTGITTTGIPHLGNYVGAIRPAIQAVQDSDDDAFFFLADYHGIIKCFDPDEIHRSTRAIAATWIACGPWPRKSYLLSPVGHSRDSRACVDIKLLLC